MQRFLFVPCALVLALPAAGRADDAADMKALIEKAIKAHGGADNLTKQKTAVVKIKGKFYGLGEGIDFSGEISHQDPDKTRNVTDVTVMGTDFKIVQVINGDKGWVDDPQGKREMTKEELSEAVEAQHASGITRLVVLANKDFTLSPLGETKVGDKEAVGVLVKHKGRRDVSLFFDKKSNQLLKSETRVVDLMGGNNEVTQEVFYDDYKKSGDHLIPHKLTIKRDGKVYVESETTDFQAHDKLEDSLFTKP
jgi:hypothetical protein